MRATLTITHLTYDIKRQVLKRDVEPTDFWYNPETKSINFKLPSTFFVVKRIYINDSNDWHEVMFGPMSEGFTNDNGQAYHCIVEFDYITDDEDFRASADVGRESGYFTYEQITKGNLKKISNFIYMKDKTVTYDGEIHTNEYVEVPNRVWDRDDVTVTYEYLDSNNQVVSTTGVSEVGTYRVVAHIVRSLKTTNSDIVENVEGNANDEANINEVIFAAKKNIAETILHSQSEHGQKHTIREICPRVDGIEPRAMNGMISIFLLSPESYVKNAVEAEIQGDNEELDTSVELTEEEKAYQAQLKEEKREQYKRAFNFLKGKETSYSAYETTRGDILNDKLNLEGYLKDSFEDSPNRIRAAFNACKPGFFERIFRRTSNEYKNFKETFAARQNGAASRDDVDNAARAYLMHKIPGYNGKGLPTVEQMEALTGTSANRAALCYKTLQASQKSRGYEAKLNIVQGVAKQNIEDYGLQDVYEKMREDNMSFNQLLDDQPDKQAAFQKNLANDVNDNNIIQADNQDLSNDDNNIIKKDDDIALE